MKLVWLVVHILIAINFFGANPSSAKHVESNVAWPTMFDGQELSRLELSQREVEWGKGFPGRIARFTDGEREFIFRAVTRPSRKLHPIDDCLKGVGYATSPLPLEKDMSGKLWGCVSATRDGRSFRVCESIADSQNQSWSDVSSWWWAATLGRSVGPWMSAVKIEKRT